MSRHNKSKRRRRAKSTAPQVPPRAPRRIDERPEKLNAPWHPFPLVEVCVLIGIVLIVLGLFRTDQSQGRVLLALGLCLGALGGVDTSVREHFAGFRSHTLVLSAFPAVATAVVTGFAGVPLVVVVPIMLGVFLLAFVALRRVWERKRVPAYEHVSFRRVSDDKRMRLRGLHHVTAISSDLERSIAFYRDTLGLPIVHDAPSDDDPEARHVWFDGGDGDSYLSFMEYAQLPAGVVGVGSTHHFALRVESPEEQEAWRDYLRERGVDCTEVLDRGSFRSIYIRDPDGHVVEIATRGPGFGAGEPPA